MASQKENLIVAVQHIKDSADTTGKKIGAASQRINDHSKNILHIVKGSQSGEQAAKLVYESSKALTDAALSLLELSRKCDKYLETLIK